MLVQEFELQLIRPPILVRRAAARDVFVARYRALASFSHRCLFHALFPLDLSLDLCCGIRRLGADLRPASNTWGFCRQRAHRPRK